MDLLSHFPDFYKFTQAKYLLHKGKTEPRQPFEIYAFLRTLKPKRFSRWQDRTALAAIAYDTSSKFLGKS